MADLEDAPDVAAELPRDSEAEYALEYPCNCPHCLHSLRTVAVVRMLRVKVNFTSTLPRRGRAVICPKCRQILTVELSTLT
ncbi:MAG TPA: hypothetical protein VK886_05950 [Vicinamibacterales bacterium]|nr:hypothetical protein [Vicinamibacterales bacterium]